MTTKNKAKVVSPVIVAFKGFDKDLACHPSGGERVQYVVGETVTTKSKVIRCGAGGFHSCEYPLDVFVYYAPATSRFALVEASGDIARGGDGEDSKIASASLTVKMELTLPKFVQYALDWVTARIDRSLEQHVMDGYQSAASNTGNRSAASNTGYQSAASNTGDYSAASNTGYQSAASNTGYRSAASNTGYRSAASNTGDYSAASNTGDQSAASVAGSASVAMASGYQGRAKAVEGSAIVLVNRDPDTFAIRHIRAAMVGSDGVKPDTWYSLNDEGEFFEVAA